MITVSISINIHIHTLTHTHTYLGITDAFTAFGSCSPVALLLIPHTCSSGNGSNNKYEYNTIHYSTPTPLHYTATTPSLHLPSNSMLD